ncbi:MAG: class I SAM-dependent methyltransferase [Syntrophales bacterium]
MPQSTAVFSDRASYYVKGRPEYPGGIIDFLRTECGLGAASTVADVGSGTGIFTRLLLGAAGRVYALEPCREMREAAEGHLSACPNLVSVDAAAEDTTLGAGSIDIITAATAFQWFNIPVVRTEFSRILKPGGWVVVIGNVARQETAYEKAYADLKKRYAPTTSVKYAERYRSRAAAVSDLYGGLPHRERLFPHEHAMDWECLVARLLSRSGMPLDGEPGHHAMIGELRCIFDRYQVEGLVTQRYDARVSFGHLP